MGARLIRSLELWVLIFALSVLIPLGFARWVEPRLFPIITRLEVTAIRPEAGGSVLAGRAVRLRACDWVETRWYLGRRGARRVPIEVRYRDAPQIRPTGGTAWEGIVLVDLAPQQVLANSHADAVYRCYGGPLSGVETVMPFYDGLGQDGHLLPTIAGGAQR